MQSLSMKHGGGMECKITLSSIMQNASFLEKSFKGGRIAEPKVYLFNGQRVVQY